MAVASAHARPVGTAAEAAVRASAWNLPALELLPGHLALAHAGERMRTLLGSCVSIILTDPRQTVGAMCHIVHTSVPGPANADSTTYGGPAMAEMFRRLLAAGVSPERCHAFVYGGGNMFRQVFSTTHVGERNANWALDFLDHHGIRVLEHSLGGLGYHRVAWTVGPGMPDVEFVPAAL